MSTKGPPQEKAIREQHIGRRQQVNNILGEDRAGEKETERMHPAGRTETTEMTHGGPRRVARSERVAERSAEPHSEWPGRRCCLAPPQRALPAASEIVCARWGRRACRPRHHTAVLPHYLGNPVSPQATPHRPTCAPPLATGSYPSGKHNNDRRASSRPCQIHRHTLPAHPHRLYLSYSSPQHQEQLPPHDSPPPG